MSKIEQSEIIKQLELLQKTQFEQKQSIDRILSYFDNDPLTNQKGLVDDFYETKKVVEGVIEREKIFAAKTAIMLAIGGVIISFLSWAFNIFYKK